MYPTGIEPAQRLWPAVSGQRRFQLPTDTPRPTYYDCMYSNYLSVSIIYTDNPIHQANSTSPNRADHQASNDF